MKYKSLRGIGRSTSMEKDPIKHGHRLKTASQAEILRSYQRDDDFVKSLREKLSDLLLVFGGHKRFLHFVQSDTPVKLIYFIVTSGIGNQTLGEEYTGIVQANLKARKVPSLKARVLSAILECFGEQALIKMLERLQASVNRPCNELTPRAVLFLNCFLNQLRTAIPLLILAHRGLFYVFGRYYSLGRRLTGVDYVKVYGQRPTDGVSWGLRLLGIATLAQCMLRLWQSEMSTESDKKFVEIESSIGGKCQLCLEAISTTATPCGHLFCWTCLADWLRARPQCPLCREHVTASRIIYLLNL